MGFQLPFMKKNVMPNKPIGITELGKRKCEEMMIEGPKYDVLVKLSENGPSSINELAQELNKDPGKVRQVTQELIRNGYAKPVSIEE